MESYPIMLNVHNKNAVVIGGGKVAYRKITSLLKAGANVTVVSPDLHERVKKLVVENEICWLEKRFEQQDIETAMIVIAATNVQQVNKQIVQFSSDHQLVNVVDNKESSNFHVPAKLTRGKLTIAVATDGASPTLAKSIRDELALIYDESYGSYLAFLSIARERVLSEKYDDAMKARLLEEIINVDCYKSLEQQKKFFERMDSRPSRKK